MNLLSEHFTIDYFVLCRMANIQPMLRNFEVSLAALTSLLFRYIVLKQTNIPTKNPIASTFTVTGDRNGEDSQGKATHSALWGEHRTVGRLHVYTGLASFQY